MATNPFRAFPKVPANPAPNAQLAGKTVIITGAASGIGLQTAMQMAALGPAILVFAVRNVGRGETAKNEVIGSISTTSLIDIRVMEVDMANAQSVVAFAQRVRSELSHVDILVLNAGLGFLREFQKSNSGHDLTTQVNHYSNALLIFELLPILTNSSTAGRVSYVGARIAREPTPWRKAHPSPALLYLDDPKTYKQFGRYSESKLAAMTFARELGLRLDGHRVIVNVTCPGMVNGGLTHEIPKWIMAWGKYVTAAIGRPIPTAANIVVNAAVYAGPESHGKFLMDHEIQPDDKFLVTQEGERFSRDIWAETLADVQRHASDAGRESLSFLSQ
ncbi:putative short-chain dehydrogenase/reductase family protein [Auriculariales sp. MPI-PUGE-AT-0066]|nr:putative short-chain dehydrogenase/reductase family protein [Auriculariales sp. MPI-PUGE-AT-0066]